MFMALPLRFFLGASLGLLSCQVESARQSIATMMAAAGPPRRSHREAENGDLIKSSTRQLDTGLKDAEAYAALKSLPKEAHIFTSSNASSMSRRPLCSEGTNSQLEGCRSVCTCAWYHQCYPHSKLGRDIGLCSSSTTILVAYSIAIISAIAGVLVSGRRMLLSDTEEEDITAVITSYRTTETASRDKHRMSVQVTTAKMQQST